MVKPQIRRCSTGGLQALGDRPFEQIIKLRNSLMNHLTPFILVASILFANAASTQEAGSDAQYAEAVPGCFERSETAEVVRTCIGGGTMACIKAHEWDSKIVRLHCMGVEAEAWDVLLNEIYQQRQAEAKRDDAENLANDLPEHAVLSEQLRAAQRAWISFRDKECRWAATLVNGGVVGDLFSMECHLDMTARRAIELKFKYREQ